MQQCETHFMSAECRQANVNIFCYNNLQKGLIKMENLRDFVKWIANQNVINIEDEEIDEVTHWLINDKNYQKLNDELIRRMKIIEKR